MTRLPRAKPLLGLLHKCPVSTGNALSPLAFAIMGAALYRSGMLAIFPERALAPFPLIVVTKFTMMMAHSPFMSRD